MDTIFAVSSGRPPAAIAVIRISGPGAFPALMTLTGSLPEPRAARLRTLRDVTGQVLDRALVLIFPGPASATGEDLAEVHCHGGRAVVEALERALAALPSLRRAEPGEFTRRALINGRIDLAEAEGLADLLSAETDRQRIAAVGAAGGRVSRSVRDWLNRIAAIAARVEATLDFADEADVGPDDLGAIDIAMAELAREIAAVTAMPTVDRLKHGIMVVLAGPPNAGKSTLINLLSDRDVAIVSPIAGTTRDRIEVPVMRDGIPYVLVDTAGLTQTEDEIERIGVGRAEQAIAAADVLLWLGDGPPPPGAIPLHARADAADRGLVPQGRVRIARSDDGSVEALWRIVQAAAGKLLPREGDIAINERQCEACLTALSWLTPTSADPLIVAEHLRRASSSLAAILGVNATETMLDALFGQFCIGK